MSVSNKINNIDSTDKPFPFMKLPAEIRHMIYSEIFLDLEIEVKATGEDEISRVDKSLMDFDTLYDLGYIYADRLAVEVEASGNRVVVTKHPKFKMPCQSLPPINRVSSEIRREALPVMAKRMTFVFQTTAICYEFFQNATQDFLDEIRRFRVRSHPTSPRVNNVPHCFEYDFEPAPNVDWISPSGDRYLRRLLTGRIIRVNHYASRIVKDAQCAARMVARNQSPVSHPLNVILKKVKELEWVPICHLESYAHANQAFVKQCCQQLDMHTLRGTDWRAWTVSNCRNSRHETDKLRFSVAFTGGLVPDLVARRLGFKQPKDMALVIRCNQRRRDSLPRVSLPVGRSARGTCTRHELRTPLPGVRYMLR